MKRFEVLDSWRGIAACGVALMHFQSTGRWGNLPVVQGAWLFVDFFFVLSGFVIAANYQERLASRSVSTAQFMLLRIGRLYPLHIVLILLLLARSAFLPGPPLADLLPTVLLVHGPLAAWGSASATWNGPSWSISVEMVCYLVFAGAVLVTPRRWLLSGAIGAIALGTLATIALRLHPTTTVLLRGLAGFAAGAVCWNLPRLRGGTALELVALALILGLVWLAGVPDCIIGCAAAAPVAFAIGISIFAGERGAVSALLRCRPFIILGTLSYSIYMVHVPLLQLGHDLGLIDKARDGTMLNFLLAAIAVSALTYRFIEKPWRQRFRRMTLASSATA